MRKQNTNYVKVYIN